MTIFKNTVGKKPFNIDNTISAIVDSEILSVLIDVFFQKETTRDVWLQFKRLDDNELTCINQIPKKL